ncbi:hypothetical protein L3Q82_015897 [Scortum barcoo]|uniref:Uncharacterized protein n=1 Tax=Scortum barcoo TaxID=214431 RepID=A0ACB8VPN0_9TELE|nr:hypothetical protein L3Q82_015897 [Scortum barcoo]
MMSYAEKPEDITKEEWMDKLNNVHIQRADMNRLIMNYLVTEGFKEAAEKFRMESGIEPTVDLDSLDERIKIREMILKGQIQEAIALINSLHPELLDTNRYLYFHLQQQHLIELIRLRETESALEFAQTQLAEQGEESRECLTEMERTLALLAFDNPEESPFGDLLNMMQRQKVWSEVNQAVLDYENRESTPKLAKLLKLLLWAQNELDQKKVKYPKMTDLSTVKPVFLRPHRPLGRKWLLMLFMGTCLLYCARMTVPICAVSMAASFHWSKINSGLVLGGFFWGYCLTQILGGYVSDKVGGERVLFTSAASWALITAATPLLAQLGSHTLALMTMARFLMGVLQGVFFPSLASLCSQRVVKGERGFLMSAMNSGSYLGTLLAGEMGSLMLDSYGWESMFYATGFLSGLWALVLWQCFLKGEDTPKQTKSSDDSQWTMSSTRWLSLLKKPPVWAMVFAHMCMCSTSYTLLSWLPTYFKESFPHGMGWVCNTIPWLAAIPSVLAGGYVSDYLIHRGIKQVSSFFYCDMRFKFFAMGVSSMFTLLLSGTVTFPSAVILVSATICLSTFTSSGVSVNVQDLTPSCAGTLYGFMNMLGAFMGLVLVSVSGYLIEVMLPWATVFSIITLVNVTGLGIFLIFGDARRVDLDSYSEVTVDPERATKSSM